MKHCKISQEEMDREELVYMARGYVKACLDVYGGTLQPRVKGYLIKATKFLDVFLIDYDQKMQWEDD